LDATGLRSTCQRGLEIARHKAVLRPDRPQPDDRIDVSVDGPDAADHHSDQAGSGAHSLAAVRAAVAPGGDARRQRCVRIDLARAGRVVILGGAHHVVAQDAGVEIRRPGPAPRSPVSPELVVVNVASSLVTLAFAAAAVLLAEAHGVRGAVADALEG